MTQEERSEYRKPVPHPTPETEFFWRKAALRELWIQRCVDCARPFFYPRLHCPDPGCMSDRVEWFQASGRGTLYTYMINHRPAPGFEEDAPYAIAVIQLEEGPRMMGNIVGIENTPENLVLDMPLVVTFTDATDDIAIPNWRPA